MGACARPSPGQAAELAGPGGAEWGLRGLVGPRGCGRSPSPRGHSSADLRLGKIPLDATHELGPRTPAARTGSSRLQAAPHWRTLFFAFFLRLFENLRKKTKHENSFFFILRKGKHS